MTAQIADTVELDAQEFSIAGVRGGPLFDPLDHRIKPGAISTACWRGYVCSYTVTAGSLRLAKLVTGSGTKVAGRALGPADTLLGSAVTPAPSWTGQGLQAAGLNIAVPFTGALLLGQGFISSAYVHMGFHPAWKYKAVIELLLEHGTVTGIADRSAEFAALRQRIASGQIPHPDGPPGGTAWVVRTFSLDYSRSIPKPGEQHP